MARGSLSRLRVSKWPGQYGPGGTSSLRSGTVTAGDRRRQTHQYRDRDKSLTQ